MAFLYLAGRYANAVNGAASVTSTSVNTNYPRANLYDGRPGKPFRFNSAAANVTMTADLNRALNGGFENWAVATVPDNWTNQSTGSASLSKETTLVNTGTGALKLNGAPASTPICQQDIFVKAGWVMTATVALRGDGTSTTQARIQNLETGKFLDSSGLWQSTTTDFASRVTATYATTTTVFTVPDFTENNRPFYTLRLRGRLTGSTVGYVDDFYVWPHISFASIHGHNLGAMISPELRSSTDNFSSSNVLQRTMAVGRPSFYSDLTSTVPHRYWRVLFSGTNHEAIEIGEWVLGQRRSLLREAPRWGEILEFTMPRLEQTAQASGEMFSQGVMRAESRKWRGEFDGHTEDQRNEVLQQILMSSNWGQYPVVIVPWDGESNVIHGRVANTWSYTRNPATIWNYALEVVEDAFAISVG